ncbi:MAG: hypothetical protein KME22_14235 [Hassallia sp. WJT32-NPBG1]|jgi:hypothetical protein|nr:hypothetical protein [Hassallia sp. WJT32-NPBG1]
MKTEDAILASAKGDIAIAAENLKTKIDLLKRLSCSAFNELNESIYDSSDLYFNDGLNVLYALTDALNQPN